MVVDSSDAFRALGHPHRLAIVRQLRKRALSCCEGERVEDCALDPASCNVGTLADAVPCAPSTLSHHLKELERAGIIERARDGRQLLCRLNEERMAELASLLVPGADVIPVGSGDESTDRPTRPRPIHPRPTSRSTGQGALHGD